MTLDVARMYNNNIQQQQLVQYQDNMIMWNIGCWCWWPGLPVGQNKVTMSASQAGAHPDITLAAVRT